MLSATFPYGITLFFPGLHQCTRCVYQEQPKVNRFEIIRREVFQMYKLSISLDQTLSDSFSSLEVQGFDPHTYEPTPIAKSHLVSKEPKCYKLWQSEIVRQLSLQLALTHGALKTGFKHTLLQLKKSTDYYFNMQRKFSTQSCTNIFLCFN